MPSSAEFEQCGHRLAVAGVLGWNGVRLMVQLLLRQRGQ
jgi:hypothetical protein